MSPSYSVSPVRRNRSYSRSPSSRASRDRRRKYSKSPSPDYRRKRRISNGDAPRPNKCLGVFGLSLNTTERDLKDLFKKFGHIENISIVFDRKTGVSRGFGFVYFSDIDAATTAKEETSKLQLDGRYIRVDFSITERPHPPTPGIYMGKPTVQKDRYRSRSRGRSSSRSRSPNRRCHCSRSSARRRRYTPSRSPSRSPRRYYYKHRY